MFRRLPLILPLLLSLPGHGAPAEGCERGSPPHTVALVELYTSEGCSSCPPADRWLGGLAGRFGPERLVPLSLHVDYWDHLGWRDPYAQPRFGERQRRLAGLSGSRTVYTPGVFAGMRELRGWHDGAAFGRRLEEINRQPARAHIALAMRPGAGRSLEAEARFSLPAGTPAGAELQGVLVLFEDGRVSRVRAGENRGATLAHDRVVRTWSPPLPLKAEAGTRTLRQPIALGEGWDAAKLGLAAFVEDSRTGEVLQAVSLQGCLTAAH